MLLLAVWATPRAEAQGSRVFPDVPSFEYPSAAPRATAFVGRVLSVLEADNAFGTGAEAEAGVGEDFPVLALKRGARPITLGFGVEAYARFSLDDPKSSLISTDWVVGLNVNGDFGAWRTTLRLYHESSHLGDEYAQAFGATRVDWSRGVLEGWVRYTTGQWSFLGNVSYALLDQLNLSRGGAAIGVDFQGSTLSVLGAPARPVLGIYSQGLAATSWRISTSARAGIAFPGGAGRSVSLSLVAHEGLSTQRQFFRRESSYLGFELRFDF